jgi:hypothetical protein
MNGFGHSLRFIPINGSGRPVATAQNPQLLVQIFPRIMNVGSACAPAFAHIGAVAAFANGMKLMGIDKGSYMFIFFANGKLYTKPIWFLLTGFRYYWKLGHHAKIRIWS